MTLYMSSEQLDIGLKANLLFIIIIQLNHGLSYNLTYFFSLLFYWQQIDHICMHTFGPLQRVSELT